MKTKALNTKTNIELPPLGTLCISGQARWWHISPVHDIIYMDLRTHCLLAHVWFEYLTQCRRVQMYDSLSPLGVDIYQWTNELNRLLDMAAVRPSPTRRTRSTDAGVLAMLKKALAIIPFADIKEAYNNKLDTNPHFEVNISSSLVNYQVCWFTVQNRKGIVGVCDSNSGIQR